MAALTFGLLAGVAHAQETMAAVLQNVQQSEWGDNFVGQAGGSSAVMTREPILSPGTVPAMQQAIARYQDIVSRGGWPNVPADHPLKLGMREPAIAALRERLMAEGDLNAASGDPQAFDSYVQAAVRRFQVRYGIFADGSVGKETLAAMNIPADFRLNQLQVNIQRIGAMGSPEGRYVLVDIPAAQIEVVENGQLVQRHTATVGRIDRQTPLLSSRLTEINFNPYWHVPPSLIVKDLIPRMQKDPNYLKESEIHIYTQSGQEVDSSQVNWNSDEATHYLFRQDPGEHNSLGHVKINFSNPYSVYLHDTPEKGFFGSNYRFESSGCMRVQNVRELVTWILRDNGYDSGRVDEEIRSGNRLDVKVANAPALFTVYISAWASSDGVVHFRDDIYKMDQSSNAVALNQNPSMIGSPDTE
ncbi:L,D-transpeptidase family protein [Faunimonas pinastri]|uniref:L,D-transpeptidase family protein n=1 Tax=Faunimonas pinastri TaxID=1855383 RepID=UPI001EEBD3EF|nr:L,D-transpeptidase family protein [Faunimonas pinastri]